jgi:hypothetical protein
MPKASLFCLRLRRFSKRAYGIFKLHSAQTESLLSGFFLFDHATKIGPELEPVKCFLNCLFIVGLNSLLKSRPSPKSDDLPIG